MPTPVRMASPSGTQGGEMCGDHGDDLLSCLLPEGCVSIDMLVCGLCTARLSAEAHLRHSGVCVSPTVIHWDRGVCEHRAPTDLLTQGPNTTHTHRQVSGRLRSITEGLALMAVKRGEACWLPCRSDLEQSQPCAEEKTAN
ncbi:unnamed protein product [Leuciscus chuanchicus]